MKGNGDYDGFGRRQADRGYMFREHISQRFGRGFYSAVFQDADDLFDVLVPIVRGGPNGHRSDPFRIPMDDKML
jgi:hypothetical protein